MSRRDVSSTDRRLRILAVAPGAEMYGSDRMFLESIRGFVERGHEVSVVVPTPGPLVTLLEQAGAVVDVIDAPVLRRSYASPSGLARLAREGLQATPRLWRHLATRAPDVLYVNTATLPLWCAVATARRVPTVAHVHEAESQASRVIRTAMSSSLPVADVVVFNSRTSRDLARRDLGRALRRTSVVPNAVDFRPVPPPRERLDGPARILYVGRLSQRKGVDLLIDAVTRLAAGGLDVRLDVVGDVFTGNEAFARSLRAQVADRGCDGLVTFHGFHPDPERFMADADVVVVPSQGPESFGNVLIEAVGAARPSVATAQDGLAEAAEGLSSVLLVPVGDVAALADAIAEHVRQWPRSRARAAIDAATVRRRHDVGTYRAAVGTVLEAAVRAPVTDSTASPTATATATTVEELVGDARVLVVSPHLDDAVLSASALLGLGRRADVLTVFDGAPRPAVRTGWDRLCGFADSDDAVRSRLEENARAFAGSEHDLSFAGLCDAQYTEGGRTASEAQALAAAIRAWVTRQPGRTLVAVPVGAGVAQPPAVGSGAGRRARRARLRRMVGPVGGLVLDRRARLVAKRARPVQHEDHVWVRDVVLSADLDGAGVLLYEEIPYLWGRRGDDEMSRLAGFDSDDVADVEVDVAVKAPRVAAYRSQLLYMHAPVGPLETGEGLPRHERYWWRSTR